MTDKHHLLGKTILAIQISPDRRDLRFITDQGDVVGETEGDCCSTSWVEAIDPPTRGFPAKVLSVGDVPMPDWGDMEGKDCVKYYGFKITTDRGDILIDYRNDSNGYYGGSLDWVLGSRHPNHDWKDL